ncbi:MAG: hypothetical protein ACRDZX_16175 [Acidimicrobiales bacterium]
MALDADEVIFGHLADVAVLHHLPSNGGESVAAWGRLAFVHRQAVPIG